MTIKVPKFSLPPAPTQYDPFYWNKVIRQIELQFDDLAKGSLIEAGSLLTFSTNSATVADGLTVYIGSAHHNATESNVYFSVPYQCYISRLRVDSGATTAGTRTYTIRKNAADTSLTVATTTTTSEGQDLVNRVLFEAGDNISLKLVTSGGTTVVNHRATVYLQKTEG